MSAGLIGVSPGRNSSSVCRNCCQAFSLFAGTFAWRNSANAPPAGT